MKTLMLGNEAAARGLYEAGCSFVSSYPGTPSTEITECAAKYPEIYAEWAPNEKVAMEAAFGASLAGYRSFCGMKHVGLNVAADPLFTLSYTGVRGGLVIGVADDAGMHSSQNEQDSRHYAIAAKLPMLEPSDAAESLAFAKLAYEISEKFDTPVLLKMCTRVAHAQSVVEPSERQAFTPVPYEKNIAKFVMMPACAKARHPIVEQRTLALQAWAETAEINRMEDGADHSIGLIASSTSYQYVKEVCGDRYPVLKLGMVNPLPVKKIQAFAKNVEKVIVVEELDGIIEAHCRAIGVQNVTGKELFGCIGEFSQNYIAEKLGMPVHSGKKLDEAVPARPPVMCAGCPHRGLFYTLKKNKLTVLGDIGWCTLGAARARRPPAGQLGHGIPGNIRQQHLRCVAPAVGDLLSRQPAEIRLHRVGGLLVAVRQHVHGTLGIRAVRVQIVRAQIAQGHGLPVRQLRRTIHNTVILRLCTDHAVLAQYGPRGDLREVRQGVAGIVDDGAVLQTRL